MSVKPKLFIGSSSEDKEIADHLQHGLEREVESTIWHQGVFGLSEGNLEALTRSVHDFDFAALVLTPDDLLTSRDDVSRSPRDNVIFELGLFMGALGRERTFIIYNRDSKLKLPSDLAGVTAATFGDRSDGNLQAALGPVCTKVRASIRKIIAAATPPKLDLEMELIRTAQDKFFVGISRGNDLPFEAQYTITFPGGRCPCGVPIEWARIFGDASKNIRFKDETIKFPSLPHDLLIDFRARAIHSDPSRSPDSVAIHQAYRVSETEVTLVEQRQKQ